MIIYSEILGKQFSSVDECMAAESEYNKKLKEEEARRKKEQEKIDKNIRECYQLLVNSWICYLDALNKADYDIDSMEDKALIFVEVVLDADSRKANNPKS